MVIASKAFVPTCSLEIFISLFTFSVSGNNILAATTAAGADITEAANKCFAKNSC